MTLILIAVLLFIPFHLSGWPANYITNTITRAGIFVAADAGLPINALGISTTDLDQTENMSNGDFELEQDTSQEWQFKLVTTDSLFNEFAIDIRQAMRFVRKIAIATTYKDASQDAHRNQVTIQSGAGPKVSTDGPLTPAFSAAELNETIAASAQSIKAAALQIIRSAKSITVVMDSAAVATGPNRTDYAQESKIWKSSAQFESRFQFEFMADSQSEYRDTSGNELSFG